MAVTDVLDKEGKPLEEEINQSNGEAKFWHLDVSTDNEVEKDYFEEVKEFGKIEATVNNAEIPDAGLKINKNEQGFANSGAERILSNI